MLKRILWFGLPAVLLVAFAACSDDHSGGSSGSADARVVADAGTDAGTDASRADAPCGDVPCPDAGAADAGATDAGPLGDPPPLGKPLSTAKVEPAEVGSWVYALHQNGQTLTAAIAAGTFQVPEAGSDAYKLKWQAAKLDDKGAIEPIGKQGQAVWLAMAPTLTGTTSFVARVDNLQLIYGGKRRRPGDIYGHGMARVPLRLQPGESVVGLARGGRKLRLALRRTKAELWLNPHDQTWTDLREGHDDPSWLGLPLLNLTTRTIAQIHVQVVESEYFEPSNTVWPGMAPLAVSHVGVRLRPKKPWPAAGDKEQPVTIPIRLRVEAKDADFAYELEIEHTVVPTEQPYRQSFRSRIDGSIQYYGVREPIPFDPAKKYAMVLSLHGAGVAGIGQAGAYGPKDWVYIIAPTNRRRFGFDHEEWGHLEDLASHDDALARFPIDPLRKYVSGHSMGGHGTWQLGILHADEFALVGPSAGWDSFYNYGYGVAKPKHPLQRARAHSDTSHYIRNLTNRTVYIIHGTADDNVPWSQALAMEAKAKQWSHKVFHHWEPGAGHWWDKDKETPGADCVDWKPMFEMMKKLKRDLTELNFNFLTPGPWYSRKYSYAQILSATSPLTDCLLESRFDGEKVVLTTSNVRTLRIDAAAIRAKGPQSITIDGKVYALGDEPLILGPTTGKRWDRHGPFNQVMHRPWCWTYGADDTAYSELAAYLSTSWAIIGNGHGCSLRTDQLSEAQRASLNIIHLGIPRAQTGAPASIDYDDGGVTIGGKTFAGAAVQFIWPTDHGLDAAMWAPKGKEGLLYAVLPFSSRDGRPDFYAWTGFGDGGMVAGGYFDGDWKLDSKFAKGL